jgi:4-amino-4-deoxy-L-arabinose transferase-like glycosyltransferase
VRLALCWAIVVLGFFTFSSRIEHYSLPLVPPLALLVGIALAPQKLCDAHAERQRERWVARGFAALAILGVLLGLAALGALLLRVIGDWGPQSIQSVAARHIHAYSYYFAPMFDLPPEIRERLQTPLLGTALALSLGTLGAWWMNRRGRRMRAVLMLSFMMAAFCLLAFHSLGLCEDAISSKQFGLALARLSRTGDSMITVGDFEAANSMNFYSPVPLEIYDGTAAVLEWGLHYPDAPSRILSKADFESRWNGARRTFLLVQDRQIAELHLDHSYPVLHSAGRTLVCNQPVSQESGS